MAGNGVISEQGLMSKLVQSRKVMAKVEGGSFERGHVDQNILSKNPEELMNEGSLPKQQTQSKIVDVDRIKQSRLPDNIKKAMIENPIHQISLNDTLDMSFVEGAKRLMEQEGLSTKSSKQQQQKSQPQRPVSQSQAPRYNIGESVDLATMLTPIIENIIRKTLDEIIDRKLTQILTAQTTASINENLVIKVGDSVFKGKITGVNKSK